MEMPPKLSCYGHDVPTYGANPENDGATAIGEIWEDMTKIGFSLENV